ncbi:MAG TPA: flagellar basal-body MS-ring/collar protein FliF [Acidobacteriaceae bacterium]
MAAKNPTWTRLQQFWASRTQSQRLLLGAGAAITAGLLALFSNLLLAPDLKPLMTGMEPADAQALAGELAAKKIPYQISPDGKGISVPADHLDAARLEVASGQSPHSGRMGFEIFDKVSWGQTEFDEKVNYQRALEGELERTIVTLGGVKSARVHLVMASESVFLDRERAAKSSVALRLSRGSLSREQAQSIQRLVAGAVDGLKPTDVAIIDADSNESLGGGGEGSAGGREVEQDLTARLVATLSPILGPDHLRASVNVEYDPGTTEESQEKYDPGVSVPLTVQRSDEQSGPGAGVGGVPGTASNVPQSGAVAGKSNVQASAMAVGDGSASSKTENSTFGVNRTTRRSLEPAGRIRRMTAAVVVDDFTERRQGPKGKWIETRMKRSPEELKQIEEVARAAIGLDTARGDVISVEDMSFTHPEAVEVSAPTASERVRKGVSDYSTMIRYAMLLLLFGLAYLLMVRPVHKRALAEGRQLPAGDGGGIQLARATGEVAQPVHGPDAAKALALKEQVVQIVKAEPASSTRAVQVWLRGETP